MRRRDFFLYETSKIKKSIRRKLLYDALVSTGALIIIMAIFFFLKFLHEKFDKKD